MTIEEKIKQKEIALADLLCENEDKFKNWYHSAVGSFPELTKKYTQTWVKTSDVLKILSGYSIVEKQKLRELYTQIHQKREFESQHTQLDRESGYFVSKPQQEFLDFLVWLEKKFAEFGLDTKKETTK